VRAPAPKDLPATVRCRGCSAETTLHPDRVTEGGGLSGCLACGHPELWTRKRFPAATGVAIVVAAALLAPSTHYVSLGAAALIDLLSTTRSRGRRVLRLRNRTPRLLAEPRHPRFDREIAERLKFGARAVMGKPMREGGTAGAPDPEH
jgi:hypothetical protein